MPIQLPIINIRINEYLLKNKIYLIDMADNVVGIIEMEPKRVTTDIYISMGYYIEELLVDGTQYVIIRKATQADYNRLNPYPKENYNPKIQNLLK